MRNLILIIVICLNYTASSQTWFVSTIGSDLNSGLNPANAFATINKAIQSSLCGDSIYIFSGTYHEKIIANSICPNNNRLIIQGDINNRPLIIGDSTVTNKYAIGAYGAGYRFRHLELTSPYPNICDQSNQVIVGDGDNFDFIDCVIRGSGYDGIKTYGNCNTSDFPVNWKIIDCQVFDNGLNCPSNGDGIDFTRCHNCLIKGSTIKNNAGYQIQVKLEARNVTIEDCHIQGKDLILVGLPGTTPQCDPLAINADSVFIRHNTLLSINDEGEFMIKLADVSNLYIENNTFIKDSINNNNIGFICFGGCRGGSMWLNYPTSPVIIENNIFYNISTTPFLYDPDIIALYDPTGVMESMTIGYNLFFDTNGEFTVPVDGSVNSLVANPLFCDYPNSFELTSASPCINAGNPSSPTDPDGSISDIGAHYYQTPCVVSSIPEYQINNYKLYPNPMNSYSILEFQNNIKKQYTFEIHNIQGQIVRVKIINTDQFIIEKKNLPNGLYFFKLYNNNSIYATGKLMIE